MRIHHTQLLRKLQILHIKNNFTDLGDETYLILTENITALLQLGRFKPNNALLLCVLYGL